MPKPPSHRGRLVVRNLPFGYTLDKLKALFSPLGPIKDAALPYDEVTRRLKGFAFIEYEHETSAAKAIEKLNNTKVKRRRIAVDWALSKQRYLEHLKKEKDSDEFKPVVPAASEDKGEEKEEEVKEKPKREFSKFYSGCTLYVRNLSYETEEDDFQEYFEQYGKLRYAKLVVDPNTKASKGTGFVCYLKEEDAKKALEALEKTEDALELDGRLPNAIVAVPREEAAVLAKNSEKQKDKRNMYLSKEGLIKPGTEAFETLTKEEIERRTNAARNKKDRLKNPNVFVSTTRLLIRNLPRALDEKKLKKICREAVEAADAKLQRVKLIRQVKIMRDDTRVVEGKPRSRGFAFVDFREHEHALACLRAINNNPGVFGEKRKPIVEFALEDHRMLRIRELKKKRTADVVKPKKKKEKVDKEGRGKRQREKRRLKQTDGEEAEESKVVEEEVAKPFKEPKLRQKRQRPKDDDIDIEVMDFETPRSKRKKPKIQEDSLDQLVMAYRKKLEKKLNLA